MLKIILSLLLSVSISYAAHPTAEGLFRNGNNPDVSSNLVVVKMMVTKSLSQIIESIPSSEAKEEEEDAVNEEQNEPFFVKFLLSTEKDRPVQVIQVIYSKGKMKKENIVSLKYISNLKEKIKNEPLKSGLFYSLLSSLALNRSQEVSTLLKQYSKDFKTNVELINREKKSLYEKYRSYLSLVKEDEALKETMENPIRPKDPEVSKVVADIMKMPYLNKDETIKLVRAQQGYEWHLKNDVMEAFFNSSSMRLDRMTFKTIEKELKLNFADFILWNGTHELPKNILISDETEELKLQILSLTHLLLGDKSIVKRYGEYRKDFEALKLEDIKETFLTL